MKLFFYHDIFLNHNLNIDVLRKMSEESEIVLVSDNEDQTITYVQLNRLEKKNAFNTILTEALTNGLLKAEQSKSRVIILHGGDDCFSSGIDLGMMAGGDPSMMIHAKTVIPPDPSDRRMMRYYTWNFMQRTQEIIQKMEKPVIARITGPCMGYAFEIAVNCDYRFCLENSVFSMVESKIGIIPDTGGTIGLTRLVGVAHAKDIVLTGRRFDGNEAYRMGVVNGVAKTVEELDAMIKSYTDEIIDSAPLAVGLTKKAIDWCYGKSTYLGLELETIVSSILQNTKDVTTGGIARMQKKAPQWRSR